MEIVSAMLNAVVKWGYVMDSKKDENFAEWAARLEDDSTVGAGGPQRREVVGVCPSPGCGGNLLQITTVRYDPAHGYDPETGDAIVTARWTNNVLAPICEKCKRVFPNSSAS